MDITITLSEEAANVIMKHLGNGPYVEVAPVIQEIRRQAAPQLAAAATQTPAGEVIQVP